MRRKLWVRRRVRPRAGIDAVGNLGLHIVGTVAKRPAEDLQSGGTADWQSWLPVTCPPPQRLSAHAGGAAASLHFCTRQSPCDLCSGWLSIASLALAGNYQSCLETWLCRLLTPSILVSQLPANPAQSACNGSTALHTDGRHCGGAELKCEHDGHKSKEPPVR